MTRWAPHLLRKQAESAGMSSGKLAEMMAGYEHAQRAGVAPVLTLRHLSQSCGVPYGFLRGCCARQPEVRYCGPATPPYRTFSVRKRSGGRRVISVPSDGLMAVQEWIHRFILRGQPCHPRAFAYQRGRSIADCASIHLGCRWLVKLDIAGFFESITEKQVYHVFRGIGYSRLVSLELARLCTRVDKMSRKRKDAPKWRVERRTGEGTIPDYAHECLGYLPQGAPTSPALSNLVARDMDEALCVLANTAGFEYSRYSDDMYFSSSCVTAKTDAIALARRAAAKITAAGFELNDSKTAIAGPGHRRVVLGILVDGERLRLTKQFRRRVEWHYRHCLVNPAQHAYVKGFRTVVGLKNHLTGLLAHARAVDPAFVERLEQDSISWPV